VEFWSISTENGNERFVIRESWLIDIVDHKLIHSLLTSSSVIIPRDIEILDSLWWFSHDPRLSISFESNSRLTRIESMSLPSFFGPITIPATVLFVVHHASPDPFQLSLCDEDSCPEFGRW
jgi:hypothetical protein